MLIRFCSKEWSPGRLPGRCEESPRSRKNNSALSGRSKLQGHGQLREPGDHGGELFHRERRGLRPSLQYVLSDHCMYSHSCKSTPSRQRCSLCAPSALQGSGWLFALTTRSSTKRCWLLWQVSQSLLLLLWVKTSKNKVKHNPVCHSMWGTSSSWRPLISVTKRSIMWILNITRRVSRLTTLFLFSVIVTSSEDTKQDFQFFLKQPEKVESELQELFLLTQPRTVLCRGLNTEAESKQTKVTSVTPDDTEESTTVPTTTTCVFLI